MAIRPHHHLIATVTFSTVLLGLIALAIGGTNPAIASWAVVSVALLAAAFHLLLRGGGFFSAVFANAIGIYACIYVFILGENFPDAGPVAQQVGFVLPLFGFLVGTVLDRRAIMAAAHRGTEPSVAALTHAASWLLPLLLIGLASFLAPLDRLGEEREGAALLIAMAFITLVAVFSARRIAVFLIDAGFLFEEFLASIARLAKPAFALLTCYSLIGMIFGCLYTILDRFSAAPAFQLGAVVRRITFAEGLYFSVATISTVGYGDVSAVSPVARILVSLEIFCGLMLILFGVEAILSARRESTKSAGTR